MVTKTTITNDTATSVFDWFYLRNCIGSARSFFHGVCSNSPVPLLRPTAAQNISSRRSALPCGSRVWHQWCLACQSVTLACSHLCPCNFCVLDDDCVGRVTGVAEQESGTDWRAVAELPPPKPSAFPAHFVANRRFRTVHAEVSLRPLCVVLLAGMQRRAAPRRRAVAGWCRGQRRCSEAVPSAPSTGNPFIWVDRKRIE